MTILASIAALNVIYRFSGGIDAIVTAKAIPTDRCMIEPGVHPCARRVAVLANIAALNVIKFFSCRSDSIVAGKTWANQI